MAEVRLSIAGREYIVTCKDGEEQRLLTLGAMVDEKAREAGGPSGGLNESRLLLFSALLLADKLHDNAGGAGIPDQSSHDAEVEQAAETLERLADRLENLALRLES
ncbi:MAG: cell division protein ZapA [Sphingomonadaceae bacterium]|nr:cell division protein ZapA [Sphingomonadaceae bacterium]